MLRMITKSAEYVFERIHLIMALKTVGFIRYAQFHGESRAYTHFLPHDVVQDAHITA